MNVATNYVPLSRSQTDTEQALLAELFHLLPYASDSIDFDKFRAKHRTWRGALDQLEKERVLQLRQNRYYLTLSAIVFVNSPESVRFMDDADALFREIQTHYEEAQGAQIRVKDLAAATGVDELRTRQVLSYMFECNVWLQTSPTNIQNDLDPTIAARDGVFDFDSFRAVVRKSDEWRVMGPFGVIAPETPSALESEAAPRADDAQGKIAIPNWVNDLPGDILDVVSEVYLARNMKLRALPAIGMRTALDLLFLDILAGDKGTFKEKVEAVVKLDRITPAEAAHVLAAIEGGNASAHRGFKPDDEDLQTMLLVTERLLQAEYVLPAATSRLKTNTPARPPKPPKT